MTGRFLDDDDTLDPDEIDELLDEDATIFGEDVTILAPRASDQPTPEEESDTPLVSQPSEPTTGRPSHPGHRQLLTIGLTIIATAAVMAVIFRALDDPEPADTPTTGAPATTVATTRATIPTTTATTTLPSSASTSAAASVISAGGWHSCGVLVDGGVVCWGLNDRWDFTLNDGDGGGSMGGSWMRRRVCFLRCRLVGGIRVGFWLMVVLCVGARMIMGSRMFRRVCFLRCRLVGLIRVGFWLMVVLCVGA